MNSFISRIQRVMEQRKDDNTVNFVERSIFTDKYCFAENCYESGMMDKIEYDIYDGEISGILVGDGNE